MSQRGAASLGECNGARERSTVTAKIKLQGRMDYQEDQSRRNNLPFTGTPEEKGENWQRRHPRPTDLLRRHLTNLSANRANREGQLPRDTDAKFTRFAYLVHSHKSKFKNASFTVFPCKGQKERLKQARGQDAYLN